MDQEGSFSGTGRFFNTSNQPPLILTRVQVAFAPMCPLQLYKVTLYLQESKMYLCPLSIVSQIHSIDLLILLVTHLCHPFRWTLHNCLQNLLMNRRHLLQDIILLHLKLLQEASQAPSDQGPICKSGRPPRNRRAPKRYNADKCVLK